MILAPFYFKQKARAALRGNWQTALLVSFFSGIFATAASLLQTVAFPDVLSYASYGMYNEYYAALMKVPAGTIAGLGVLSLLSFVLTPALMLGCNHYFVCRIKGEDLGMAGLWSRMNVMLRALWLEIVMVVRIFLWGLLLVVPGVIAAIRYSMAPYYMAEDPTLSASEAIEKSKHAMQDMKTSYFALILSFVGWSLAAMAMQMLLGYIGVVVALVAGQFMQLMISAYMNAACASFYLAVSSQEGVSAVKREMEERMRQMGVRPDEFDRGARRNGGQDDGTDSLNADDNDDPSSVNDDDSSPNADVDK